MPEINVVATGLEFPEGPIAMPDGSVLLVEIKRGRLTRVIPDGKVEVVAEVGGGPNGAAIGPDGKCYIANAGNFGWLDVGGGVWFPAPFSDDGPTGGKIQRVDLESGRVEDLYTECGGRAISSPNDLVFDSSGGFWFTDFGAGRERSVEKAGVFYCQPDGSSIREVIFPVDRGNGIGLSPDERTLYVAETFTGRLQSWALSAPGELAPAEAGLFGTAALVTGLGGVNLFDSLAVEAGGNICCATLAAGGVNVISPTGDLIEHVNTGDSLTTNICFGGDDMQTAYITCAASGKLITMQWSRPGLKLAY